MLFRFNPACGTVRRPDGSRIVLVAGGESGNKVDMYDVNTGEWTASGKQN